MSCPLESVPRRCSREGLRSRGTTFHRVGSYGAKKERHAKMSNAHSTQKLTANL
jgi:hypothetical protein